MRLRVAVLLLGAVLAAGPALAGPPDSVLSALGLPGGRATGTAAETEALQTDLSWVGLHRGQIDGRGDGETRASIDRFQAGLGAPATGRLGPAQRRALATRAAAAKSAMRFRSQEIAWTGIRLRLPLASLNAPEVSGKDDAHVRFTVSDVPRTLIVLERYRSRLSPAGWLEQLRDFVRTNEMRLAVSGVEGAFAYAVGISETRRHYMLYEVRGGEVRGVDLSLSEDEAVFMRPVVAEILGGLDAHAGPGVPFDSIPARMAAGDYPGVDNRPDWHRRMVGNGSGSIVSAAGHVLTNHHVVSGCAGLTINGTPATLVGSDVRLDLALVRAAGMAGRTPARFAERPIRLGEDVLVMGYPIFSISPSLNVTTGIVSSTVGFLGDRTRIQITAPVQPGNSGGPVLSRRGELVAVVVTKLSSEAASANNAENVGWVIRAAEAHDFLDRMGLRPVRGSGRGARPALSEGVREWRRFTVRVECQGE